MAFDGGYLEDLDVISSVLTKSKMMFFSATIREEIEPFIKKFMTNVKLIDLGNTNDNKIKHIWIPLKHKEKEEVLLSLLKVINPKEVIKLQIIVLHFFSFIDIKECLNKKDAGIDGFLFDSLFFKIGK